MQRFEAQLRLATGLILALYVTQHLINHAFGIVSIEAAEAYRKTVGALFQNPLGLILLYGSLLFHALIALRSIYRRSSLRMSLWQWLQLLLGLSILPLVAGHAVGNRGFDQLGNIDPDYYQVVTSLLSNPVFMYKLGALLIVAWIHLAIGLHFWLRIRAGYARVVPYAYALAVLIPTLSYIGCLRMLMQASEWLDDPERLQQIYAAKNAMDPADVEFLAGLETRAWAVMAALLVLTLIARQLRIWLQARRGTYRISHSDGHKVRSLHGVSLLEALRNARIPHAAVCGGRARCTTCRVRVGIGLDQLETPNELESRALARIGAGPQIRLACQLYPRADLEITPLVMAKLPLAGALHAGGVQGHEEYVVAMFVDMRGSTNLGERVLAYDVVFILNRFFTELSSALGESHGHYAQFAGDGLMALYGLQPERKQHACRDALAGAREMFRRIDSLNQQLQREFGETVKMGIGIHGGDAIVGTMGPPKTPLLTAVGDNINIAARLEAQTKQQGCDLIVSAETLEREAIAYPPASVSDIEVRGRANHVRACRFDRNDLPAADND
ncbi:MAG: adenylate/guanylate cyclase domain-containing protein [Gammaproteobacteria bacterium]|nr:MAG: adenylate/guanylate cyclase domain-containing protein [Gammaproteobacteria bacterium]UCH41620.1 MAG: adenylate/guanylate cyclase domain-containing protein [Gammaproteobacteria bacterium]